MKLLHLNNVSELFKQIPDGMVNMIVTSPPYWSLRDRPTTRRCRDGGRKHRENGAAKKPRASRTLKDVE